MEEQGETRDVTVYLQSIEVNLSPDAFHLYASHYYRCKQDFEPPDNGFSPVPYFLLCRAIELEIKARHLKHKNLDEVKVGFGHHLMKAYNALDVQERILSQREVAVLATADEIYSDKGFEYFTLRAAKAALQGYSQFPDLKTLDTIAKNLIDSGATKRG